MECGWYAYQSKAGETLFFYNQITGQYRWLSCSCSRSLDPTYDANNNAFKAINTEETEKPDDPVDSRRIVPVRSIATETDLPLSSSSKILKTQGTQTDILDTFSCVEDLVKQDVLSSLKLTSNGYQNVLQGNKSIDTLSNSNKSLILNKNNNYESKAEEKCKLQSKQIFNKVKLFECTYCEKAFTSYSFLIKHEKYHVENNSLKKDVLEEQDLSKTEFSTSTDNHMIGVCVVADQSEKGKDFSLDKDGEGQLPPLFNTPPSPATDSEQHSQECFQCGKSFSLFHEYEAHLRTHLEDKCCNPCNLTFNTIRTYQKHFAQHVGRKHQCPLCKCKYMLKFSLTKHLLHFHKIDDNVKPEDDSFTYKCGCCEELFKQPYHLVIHQKKTRHKELEYHCNKCDKYYSIFSDLQQHQLKEHVYDNSTNSTLLASPAQLKLNCDQSPLQREEEKKPQSRRSTSSTGDPSRDKQEGRYWCNKCNVSYSWQHDLVKHKIRKRCVQNEPMLRKNGDTLEYFCRYCDKVFHQSTTFVLHLKKHYSHSKSPFKCFECGKTFLKIESLEKHYMNHVLRGAQEENTNNKKNLCKGPHSCKVCGKSFNKIKNLHKHRGNHRANKGSATEEEEYHCDKSDKVLSDETGLFECRHLSTKKEQEEANEKNAALQSGDSKTNKSTKKQPDSEPRTNRILKLNRKLEDNNIELQHKCFKCGKVFSSSKGLRSHMTTLNHWLKNPPPRAKSKHVKKSKCLARYHCQICKRSFQYYNVFYKHRQSHKVEKTKGCKDCGRVFPTAHMLSVHTCVLSRKALKKNEKGLLCCRVCKKGFLNLKGLTNHMRIHLYKEGYFVCQNCRIVFADSERLAKHMKEHKHPTKQLPVDCQKKKTFECNLCGKIISSKSSLMRHQRSCTCQQTGDASTHLASKKQHKGEQQKKKSQKKLHFDCQKCKKSFSQFSDLVSHCSSLHDNERPCCKCFKTFANFGNLKRHLIDAHSKEKGFHCGYCSKEFYTFSNFESHTSLVPGVKKHKCKSCDQAYALCMGLAEHAKVHAKE